MLLEMVIPSPGESISEVEIAEWLVEDGDFVEKDQVIAEIDSDKATLELPAEQSGNINIVVKEGETVAVGDVVCLIDTSEVVTNKSEPYWFDVFVEGIIKAGPADLKVVEDHSNLDVLDEDELVGEAEDTLTILTKHIEGMEITGDKTKLENLVRSLYTEALDVAS